MPPIAIALLPRTRPVVVLVAVGLVALLPLWSFVWPPSVDWSRHVADVDFLVRIWRHDPAIVECYQLSVQPVGYHLFYLFAVPLAYCVGAAVATKLVMSAALMAHIWACAWASRRQGGPSVLGLVGIPMFYGIHFTWGFVVSLLAAPIACVPLALLAQGAMPGQSERRAGSLACGMTILAGITHAVFAPILAAAAVVAAAIRGRAAWTVASRTLAGAIVVTLPGAWVRARAAFTSDDASRRWHATLKDGIELLQDGVFGVDQAYAFAGLVIVTATLLATAISACAVPKGRLASLYSLAQSGLFVALVWAIPYKTRGPVGSSYLLNIRALCLILFIGVLASCTSPSWHHRIARRCFTLLVVIGSMLTLGGVWQLSKAFDNTTADWQQAVGLIAPGSRFAATSRDGQVGSASPPLLLGIPSMASSRALGQTNFLFLGNQLPLAERKSDGCGGLEPPLDALVRQLDSPASSDGVIAECWRRTDVAFVRRVNLEALRDPFQEEAAVWARGRQWQLWGPPSACFPANSWHDSSQTYACEPAYDFVLQAPACFCEST